MYNDIRKRVKPDLYITGLRMTSKWMKIPAMLLSPPTKHTPQESKGEGYHLYNDYFCCYNILFNIQ